MGGQSLERREVLQILAMAAAASTFPGFRRWSFACDHSSTAHDLVNVKSDPYRAQFFLPEEYSMVADLAEMIIPNDGKPGAREAGVSEFIDFMVSCTPAVQTPFKYGLSWLNGHAVKLFSKPFPEISRAQQLEILEHLAYKDRHRPGEEEGREFFNLLRSYTVMGFYSSKIGLENLDYPGLQAVWDEMPECPHKHDPEHLHLPPPQF
jgi:gluconate 2-dehydrogenase gamma chain